jgi:oxygen-dependent protoporphyrinogen oxidase
MNLSTNNLHESRGSVAIIGAGVTGLTAAYRLRGRGVPVTVYEAGGCVGGVIQSVRRNGYLAESGPNTILETSPKIAELVRDLGLESRRLYSDPQMKNRYVVRDGQLVNMPSSPIEFIRTRLFSTGAKLRLLAEPFIGRAPEEAEESIAEFVVRRLGHEFLEQAIDALVSGIYAGDPAKLSVPQAFPKLHQLEKKYGSLIKGQIMGAAERKRSGEVPKTEAPKMSFDDGLQVLTDTLAAKLYPNVRLLSPVVRLEQKPHGWTVVSNVGGTETSCEHLAVLYAGTAFRLAEMNLVTKKSLDVSGFANVEYPPVSSVVLGFRREDVAHPLDGFGALIPRCEGMNILGTLFTSSLFPNRAPAGCVTLTSYLGGARAPELAKRPAKELFDLTLADLRKLVGVRGEPTFRHHTFYPKAIPQYNVGFGAYRARMKEIETKAPGLFIAGHCRDGVSLGDSILAGTNVVERIRKYVAAEAQQIRLHIAEAQAA